MSDPKFGAIIPVAESHGKDAVHIACVPIIVGEEEMWPGSKVKLSPMGLAVHANEDDYIGVIDPYLPHNDLKMGTKVWLMLRPRTITSIRHEWSHPAFDQFTPSIEKSKKWIENWADTIGLSYDELMKAARVNSYTWGRDDYPEFNEGFWEHYRVLTGKSGSGSFFRCAC